MNKAARHQKVEVMGWRKGERGQACGVEGAPTGPIGIGEEPESVGEEPNGLLSTGEERTGLSGIAL